MLIKTTSRHVSRRELSSRPSRRRHRVTRWSSPHRRRRLRAGRSRPSASDAAVVPARSTSALAPPLMPLLDLVAGLIARGIFAQRRESNTELGPDGDPIPLTRPEALSPFMREGGTSQSDSQITTNFSSNVPLNSHHHPDTDDLVITKEKQL